MIRLLCVFSHMGRGIHRFVRRIEPWVLLATSAAVIPSLVALTIELEDRQSQRIFQAWEVVFDASKILVASRSQQKTEDANSTPNNGSPPPFYPPPVLGSGVRHALQFLNSKFEESGCSSIIHGLSKLLAGNRSRKCIFPDKGRESFKGLKLPQIDISGVRLPNADLREMDLFDATLTGATLINADLFESTLIGATLSAADLTRADLTRADLTRATLAGAELTKAELVGVKKLSNATLTGADLTGADLTGADLTNATFNLVDLRGATLDRAQLPDVQDGDMCIWHDATGPTQSWTEPADDCRERLLKFLTDLACQDRPTAEAVVRQHADISEPEEQIPPILDPTEVARALLETDPDVCAAVNPHREDLRKILVLKG